MRALERIHLRAPRVDVGRRHGRGIGDRPVAVQLVEGEQAGRAPLRVDLHGLEQRPSLGERRPRLRPSSRGHQRPPERHLRGRAQPRILARQGIEHGHGRTAFFDRLVQLPLVAQQGREVQAPDARIRRGALPRATERRERLALQRLALGEVLRGPLHEREVRQDRRAVRVRGAREPIDQRKRLPAVTLGILEAAQSALEPGQVVQLVHRAILAAAALLDADRHGLLDRADPRVELAEVLQHDAEVVEGRRKFVATRRLVAQDRHRLLGARTGLGQVLRLDAQRVGQRRECRGAERPVVGSPRRDGHRAVRQPHRLGAPVGVGVHRRGLHRHGALDGRRDPAGTRQRERLRVLRQRIARASEAGERIAQHATDLGRLGGQLAERARVEVRDRALERLAHRDVRAPVLQRGVRALDDPRQVRHHARVLLGTALGGPLGRTRNGGLARRVQRGHGQRHHHRGKRGRRPPVPAQRARRSTHPRGACRERDLAAEPPLEVLAERRNRLVPVAGIGRGGAQAHGIEVAVDATAGRRMHRRRIHARGADRGGQSGAAPHAQRRTVARRAVGKQLVKHRSKRERVVADVGRRTLGLLRGHGLRRADGKAVLGARVGRGERRIERLRDAEVDHPHARPTRVVGRHHHVRGLQIAVDHTAAVRVLHRRARLHHEFDPRTSVEPVLAGEVRHGQPGHEGHGEPRASVGQLARVEHGRDAGMVERRQHLPLGPHARRRERGGRALAQHLHRDQPAHRRPLAPQVDVA